MPGLAETDGTMVPIVITDSDGQDRNTDRRKNRKVVWQEGRLTLARQKESVTPVFGATMAGPGQTGDLCLDCAIRAGLNPGCEIHCLGDGATSYETSWGGRPLSSGQGFDFIAHFFESPGIG
jgi:hypothetical protein